MSLCDFHYQVLRAEKGVLDEQAAGRASAAALRKELSQAEDAHRASLAKSRDEITILGLEKSKAAQQNRREIAALRAQLSAGTSDVYASMHYMKTPTGPSGRPQAAEAGTGEGSGVVGAGVGASEGGCVGSALGSGEGTCVGAWVGLKVGA